MDTDSFVLSVNAIDNIKDLENLNDSFDFTNLTKHHAIFNNINKTM